MATIVNKTDRTVGLRLPKIQITRIDKQVENGDYLNRSSWLRAAILDKLTADEAKLRINDQK